VIEVPAGDNAALATLTLSFDEELAQWLLPWDRRSRALAPGGDALLEDRKLAESVSRGGPFHDDLEMLWPAGLRGWLLGRRRPLLRRVGRRERLRQTWHVVWEQWASGAIGSHVEVIVPAELSIVRLRCLHPPDTAGELKCDVARQVGLRAHINLPSEQRQPPELMSLLLAEHDQRSWKAGTTVALLTGVLLTLAVWLLLPRLEAQLEATVALILLGPAFTAGLLSLRAASEIADELLSGVRFLLALVALATVGCAAVLIVGCDLATRVLVSAFGAMLVGVGLLLFLGAQRAGQLQQESAERETVSDVPIGARLCAREDRVRTPLPDRWIVSGEGERMPWGWLPSGQGSLGGAADPTFDLGACEEDRRYWANVLGTGVGAAAVQHLIDFCRQARG